MKHFPRRDRLSKLRRWPTERLPFLHVEVIQTLNPYTCIDRQIGNSSASKRKQTGTSIASTVILISRKNASTQLLQRPQETTFNNFKELCTL